MWSKLLITVMTAVFIFAVSFPAAAHDGRISNIVETPQDEQPWGGEHYSDDPDFPLDFPTDSDISEGGFFFIKVTIHRGWISVKHYLVGVFEPAAAPTKTGQSHPIDETPEETVNPDNGVRTE